MDDATKLRLIKEALFPDFKRSDAGYMIDSCADTNLMGVLIDMREGDIDHADINTVERVIGQIEKARNILNGEK